MGSNKMCYILGGWNLSSHYAKNKINIYININKEKYIYIHTHTHIKLKYSAIASHPDWMCLATF